MKLTTPNTITKLLFAGILAVLMIFSFDSCTQKIAFQNSAVVPAARGYIKVKKDNNKNYAIKIQLFNLAEVKRVETSKQSYVVWMEGDNNMAKNIGQINSSTSMLSKKLKASFETVSSVKPTKIFITAEEDVSTQYPGLQIILSTDRF